MTMVWNRVETIEVNRAVIFQLYPGDKKNTVWFTDCGTRGQEGGVSKVSQMARTRTEWMAVPFLKVRNIGGEKCFQGEDDVILGGRS